MDDSVCPVCPICRERLLVEVEHGYYCLACSRSFEIENDQLKEVAWSVSENSI